MHKYQLTNYFDVWGNEEDGWIVNKQCVEFTDLNIADDATTQEILDYLKSIGFLATSNPSIVGIREEGFDMLEIFEVYNNCPIAMLSRVY